MIYIYKDSINIEKKYLDSLTKLLDSDRMVKMNRYKFQKDKNLCLVAFVLLRFAIWNEYSIDYIPKVCTNEYGKPYFSDLPIFFNLSHCDNAVLCTIDSQPVGADIQNYSNEIFSLKDSILTPLEIEHSTSDSKEVTRFWTIKEAYGKYHGYGLNYPFKDTEFSYIRNSYSWQNYEDLKVISCQFLDYSISVFSKECMLIKYVSIEDLANLINIL